MCTSISNYLNRNIKKITIILSFIEIIFFIQLFIVFYGMEKTFRELRIQSTETNKYDFYMEMKMSFYKGELAHPKGNFYFNFSSTQFLFSSEFQVAIHGFLMMTASFVVTNLLMLFGILRKNSDLMLQWFWVSIVAILVGIISNAILYRIDENEDKDDRLEQILVDYSFVLIFHCCFGTCIISLMRSMKWVENRVIVYEMA